MYEEHLKRIEFHFGELEGYEDAEPGEKCVILLRKKGTPYGGIQHWMGNPSKKWIRQVLLKWAPELIDLDCNHNKLKAKPTKSFEKQLIHKLNQLPSWLNVETDDDIIDFELVDGRVKMKSDLWGECFFTDWDVIIQQQILNSINNENS